MQREWTGSYLDGVTAIRRRVTIRLLPNGLYVTTEDGKTLVWRYNEIRQTQGFYAGEEVRLEHGGPNPEVLIVPDRTFLAGLTQLMPRLASRVHDPARRATRIVLTLAAAVVSIGIVAALYLWAIPALTALAAPRVPVSWEEQLGRTVVEQLAPPEARCDDPALTHRLDEILAALTAPLPRSPYTFRVIVANDPTFNALAAPGGYIVVFRGLLKKTRTPEELAGVFAHEMQHVLRRHTTRALLHHASAGLLLAALTGDASGAMAFGLESARTIGFLQYSRRHEMEADEEGLQMVSAAGIDPAGMIAFFETLSEEAADLPGMLKYLSTHPSTAERIERLRALAARADRGPATPLPHDDWLALRDACSARPDPADDSP